MDNVYRQIVDLQHKMRDYLDDREKPVARQLEAEVQRLEDDAQIRKNPRSIEDRVKRLISFLDGSVGDSRIMSPDHVDDLRDRLVDIQMNLRKLM